MSLNLQKNRININTIHFKTLNIAFFIRNTQHNLNFSNDSHGSPQQRSIKLDYIRKKENKNSHALEFLNRKTDLVYNGSSPYIYTTICLSIYPSLRLYLYRTLISIYRSFARIVPNTSYVNRPYTPRDGQFCINVHMYILI